MLYHHQRTGDGHFFRELGAYILGSWGSIWQMEYVDFDTTGTK